MTAEELKTAVREYADENLAGCWHAAVVEIQGQQLDEFEALLIYPPAVSLPQLSSPQSGASS